MLWMSDENSDEEAKRLAAQRAALEARRLQSIDEAGGGAVPFERLKERAKRRKAQQIFGKNRRNPNSYYNNYNHPLQNFNPDTQILDKDTLISLNYLDINTQPEKLIQQKIIQQNFIQSFENLKKSTVHVRSPVEEKRITAAPNQSNPLNNINNPALHIQTTESEEKFTASDVNSHNVKENSVLAEVSIDNPAEGHISLASDTDILLDALANVDVDYSQIETRYSNMINRVKVLSNTSRQKILYSVGIFQFLLAVVMISVSFSNISTVFAAESVHYSQLIAGIVTLLLSFTLLAAAYFLSLSGLLFHIISSLLCAILMLVLAIISLQYNSLDLQRAVARNYENPGPTSPENTAKHSKFLEMYGAAQHSLFSLGYTALAASLLLFLVVCIVNSLRNHIAFEENHELDQTERHMDYKQRLKHRQQLARKQFRLQQQKKKRKSRKIKQTSSKNHYSALEMAQLGPNQGQFGVELGHSEQKLFELGLTDESDNTEEELRLNEVSVVPNDAQDYNFAGNHTLELDREQSAASSNLILSSDNFSKTNNANNSHSNSNNLRISSSGSVPSEAAAEQQLKASPDIIKYHL
jgi:hypothetical protein